MKTFVIVQAQALPIPYHCPLLQVAEDFGGGGHKAAAGCRLEMILDDAEIAILSALKSRMKE